MAIRFSWLKESWTKNSRRLLFCYLIGGITGGACTFIFLHSKIEDELRLERRTYSSQFVWPLIDCFHPSDNFRDLNLKDEIESKLDALSASNNVSISLLVKGHLDGLWYGYHENEPIKMGSLFKVISMINYLKQAESNPSIMDHEIVFNDSSLLQYYQVQGVHPEKKLELGHKYKVRDLIEKMILYSDNVASIFLEGLDQKLSFKKMALELDIPIYPDTPPFRPITIQEFASFFKILFNSTYLTKDHSEYALKLLTTVDFKGGMRAAIPPEIPVAHKFGEALQGNQKFFNDCGIVYQKRNPFLLCLSVRGKKMENLEPVARLVAKLVFDAYQKQTPSAL